MKKLIIAIVVAVSMSAQAFAVTITISVSTKSHWDGSICAPAEKGLCIRGTIGALTTTDFNGNIAYDKTEGIILTFSKSKDMTQTIFSSYFSGGSFLVDGDSSIPSDVLKKIYCPYSTFTIKQGKYSYTTDGDIITVIIPSANQVIAK